MRAAKKYNTQYKKRVDVERDTYLPKLSPKEVIQCTGCGAFYHRRHWVLAVPVGFKLPVHVHPIYCPACRKIKQGYPSGELSLKRIEATERQEILRILHNEEEQTRAKNPLEMIMGLQETDGNW